MNQPSPEAILLLQKYTNVQIAEQVVELRKIETTAREFRNAELKNAAHRTNCKNGCDDDGYECDEFGEIWLDEMRKRKVFWDALKAGGE